MKKLATKTIATALAALMIASICLPAAFAAVGDVNGDGALRSTDARLVLRYCARLEPLSAAQQRKADLNYDGKVTSADARLLLRASARLISLDNFYQYNMQAVFTNSATGASSSLDTAWMSGKAYIRLDSGSALIYDSAAREVTIVNYTAKQYNVMSFAVFQRQYPKNAEYFADNGKSLCWSEHLPTPMYLEDLGYARSTAGSNIVYYKDYAGGYQRYTFNASRMPVKCEYYYNGSLMTLDIKSFSNNPAALFEEYLGFRKE